MKMNAIANKGPEGEMPTLIRNELHLLLDTIPDTEVEELILYLSWILNTPYSS